MSVVREVNVAGKTLKFEFQKYAKQANGSVMVSCGDTQVLVTVTAADKPKPGQSFFPLTVDYIEKQYAAGRIPGGYLKRETKPSDLETLVARVIDRPLRPCFPEGYMCETHVVCTVMSYDAENSPATLACLGASTALMISDIPFNGPVASLDVALKEGKLELFPNPKQRSDLELTVAGRPGALLMVEAAANFLSETQMIDAIFSAHTAMQPLFDFQQEIQRQIGQKKREVTPRPLDAQVVEGVRSLGLPAIREAFAVKTKRERNQALTRVDDQVATSINPDGDEAKSAQIAYALEDLKYGYIRRMILEEGRRIDGRGLDDIRPILCETGVLKRPHGSALFQRGETQALATVTLGAADDEQRIDSIIWPNHSKKFMLHYNFPPFSVGEARPLRSPGRREVGHGFLAESALDATLPDPKEFGYTIRLVSEVLESNGSSSMATVCAGTMALLDAGVPIRAPVAGIAMGLIKEGEKFAVLTDILGDEDHLGDMDFKVCGSAEGISALQMDIKIDGISRTIAEQALAKAKIARMTLLKHLNQAIAEPKALSDHAPRIFRLKIAEDRIRDLIGPGGKTIKRIIAETGVKIDVDDSGYVSIVSPDVPSSEAAKKMIRAVTADPEVGEIYMGTVKRIMDFGAFVEIRPGLEGLVHISQIDNRRVESVRDVLKEGEEVVVKLIEVDHQGRLKLSRKEALGKKPTVTD